MNIWWLYGKYFKKNYDPDVRYYSKHYLSSCTNYIIYDYVQNSNYGILMMI